jgi:anti-anti-sigma factor
MSSDLRVYTFPEVWEGLVVPVPGESAGIRVVTLSGELDHASGPGAFATLTRGLGGGTAAVVVADLAAITYCTLEGLVVLVHAASAAAACGAQLRLAGAHSQLRQLLERTGAAGALDVYPSVPGAPTITGVTARHAAVDLSWSPPADGTSRLTSYTVIVYSAGKQVTTVSEAASATDAILGGLTDGTEYVFTLKAVNASGASPASAPSAPITPQPASAPMASANVQAFPQDGQIQGRLGCAGGRRLAGHRVHGDGQSARRPPGHYRRGHDRGHRERAD